MDKIIDYLPTKLNKKLSLVLILTFTIIAVIDSTITRFVTYSGIDPQLSTSVSIFILFSIGFAIIGLILVNSVKKNTSKFIHNLGLSLKYFYMVAFTTQILMVTIIVLVVLQMTFFSRYGVILLQVSTFLTHLSALVFVISLVYMFIGWLKSKRSYIIMLYAISFLLLSITLVVSMIYLEYHFSRSLSMDRKPFPIYLYVIRQEVTGWSESLNTIFDVLHLISFFALWLATVTLLNQYRHKFGRIKYFIMITVPLIYYLFPLQAYFGNVFSPLILNSPITFGIIYVLFSSATEQVGALLFSITFLTASTIVPKEAVRNSMLISAIGIAILFGSVEIATLQYRLFPPFGLITEAFMPMGSFLLFTGIFISSTSVAQDAQLRRDFFKSAEKQLTLFRTMGAIQMEKELVKKFKYMEKRAIVSGKTEEPYQEEEDVKQIVREVLNEINKNKDKS